MSIVGSIEVFSGKRFSVYVEEHRLPNGRVAKREVVKFPETVMVLPVIDREHVILLYQYRAPIRRWIYEIPAGVIEEGENPEEAANRELVEETGYRARKLVKVYPMYLAPGYSTEKIHAFIGYDLEEVGAKPEDYEVIRVVKKDLDDVVDMIKEGLICDAKSIALILYYISFMLESKF